MPYWIIKNCRLPATFLKASARLINHYRERRTAISMAAALLCLFLSSSPSIADAQLLPYQATYTTNYSGITANMEQRLKKTGSNQWSLHNNLSIMFVGFEEKAQFLINNLRVQPQTYHYSNKLSSKRNSALTFNPKNHSVIDSLHTKTPLVLPEGALDKLSFQAQMRLDFMAQDPLKAFKDKEFSLVDRTKYKTYRIKYLSEEVIETPAGKFNTVKIEQRRPGKDKYTLIWLAKDWDYFVLRIQRMEKGESEYQVNLKQAVIDGKTIKGL